MHDQFLNPFEISAASALLETETRILKQGETFGVFDRFGDLRRVSNDELGIYHRGTRFLSELRFRVGQGERLLMLNSVLRTDNGLLKVEMTNPDMVLSGDKVLKKGSLYFQRHEFLLEGSCYQRFTVQNFSAEKISIPLHFRYGADYADIFEVRGMKRARRGELLPVESEGREVRIAYRGLDGLLRTTILQFSREGTHTHHGVFSFWATLEPQESFQFHVNATFYDDTEKVRIIDRSDAAGRIKTEHSEGLRLFSRVESTNDPFNLWVDRSTDDLIMLSTKMPTGDSYPYAGIPWYCTAFGRDGIWTALECLWANPSLARGVLKYLAATQATETSAARDSEPGKIIHEVRDGEMAALHEIPFGRYYGSVDSTPLFIMLAGEYYDRTGDDALIKKIWPNLLAALNWINKHGDLDGDGFIEYQGRTAQSLANQGWKDSHDAIFHEDGSDADGPIALCEVQAYVYAAKMHMAKLARYMDDSELSIALCVEADRLKARFDEAFWDPALRSYVLALDGQKKPCRISSSNAGHCLYTGIVPPKRYVDLTASLMRSEMFNGWGLRTVAARSARYNPMSYHNGSVWPHDTAIVALGLARAGQKAAVEKIFDGLFNAVTCTELTRMPEVYCGFDRHEDEPPTVYPTACSPQAWSAAVIYALLQAMLGISFDHHKDIVRLHKPFLPESLQELTLKNVALNGSVMDIVVKRYDSDVAVRAAKRSGRTTLTVES